MSEPATVHQFKRKGAEALGALSTVSAVLQLGSKGVAVTELQAKLNLLGYGPLELSGSFEEKTREALMRFQKAEALAGSGMLDVASDSRLNQRVLASTGNVRPPRKAGMNEAPNANTNAAPAAPRPMWQTGLMVLGGITIAGGILYLLSGGGKDDDEGYRKGLPRDTIEHDPDAETRYTREVRVKGRSLRGAEGADASAGVDREKCARTPDVDALTNAPIITVGT